MIPKQENDRVDLLLKLTIFDSIELFFLCLDIEVLDMLIIKYVKELLSVIQVIINDED
jgi:hypothetical protein